jgi:uncharacterized membrane protein YoaK (UPF0700 family)
MQTAERNILLYFLAITSGSADGWSYMRLGHAFVANMTGNTVLLGIALINEYHEALHPLISLVFYVIGVSIGTYVTRNVKHDVIWSKSITRTLFLEGIILLASEVVWIWARGMPSPLVKLALLSSVAIGIGLQSGALLPLRLPGIITTYISGTWTTLVSGVVLMSSEQQRMRGDKTEPEERIAVQAIFLIIYFVSAVATGCAAHYRPILIGGISLVPVLIVVAYSGLCDGF